MRIVHLYFCIVQRPCSAATGTGIYASAQLVFTFPAMKSIVSDALLLSLQEQAQALLNASDLSPLHKAQYQFQSDWLADDVATVEFLLFPSYGQAITPTPGSAYITLNVGHMVSMPGWPVRRFSLSKCS